MPITEVSVSTASSTALGINGWSWLDSPCNRLCGQVTASYLVGCPWIVDVIRRRALRAQPQRVSAGCEDRTDRSLGIGPNQRNHLAGRVFQNWKGTRELWL